MSTRESPVEQHMHDTDGMPGGRAALPAGTLPSPPPDPQGDESRTPSPVQESGRGTWARRMDLGMTGLSPTGNREPTPAPADAETERRKAARG